MSEDTTILNYYEYFKHFIFARTSKTPPSQKKRQYKPGLAGIFVHAVPTQVPQKAPRQLARPLQVHPYEGLLQVVSQQGQVGPRSGVSRSVAQVPVQPLHRHEKSSRQRVRGWGLAVRAWGPRLRPVLGQDIQGLDKCPEVPRQGRTQGAARLVRFSAQCSQLLHRAF